MASNRNNTPITDDISPQQREAEALRILAFINNVNGATNTINAGKARKERINGRNAIMSLEGMHQLNESSVPDLTLGHWPNGTTSNQSSAATTQVPAEASAIQSPDESSSASPPVNPTSPASPMAMTTPPSANSNSRTPDGTSATPSLHGVTPINPTSGTGSDHTNNPVISTGDGKSFRKNHPEPHRFRMNLTHHITKEVRHFEYPNPEQFDWGSSKSINTLNKWYSQAVRRCTGKRRRNAVEPYLREEREWVSVLSLADSDE